MSNMKTNNVIAYRILVSHLADDLSKQVNKLINGSANYWQPQGAPLLRQDGYIMQAMVCYQNE